MSFVRAAAIDSVEAIRSLSRTPYDRPADVNPRVHRRPADGAG
jgi:hypothetical protein